MRRAIYLSARTGTAQDLPEWVSILQMAEEWGTPPWVIEKPKPDRLLWRMRWRAYRRELNRAERDRRREANRSAKQ